MVISSTRFFGRHRFRRCSRLRMGGTAVLLGVGSRFLRDRVRTLSPRLLGIGASASQAQSVRTCDRGQEQRELRVFSFTIRDDGKLLGMARAGLSAEAQDAGDRKVRQHQEGIFQPVLTGRVGRRPGKARCSRENTGRTTYLCAPSPGLPDCRRPPSGPFRLAFDLKDGRAPPGFCVGVEELRVLPEALLAAGTELTVEAMELRRQDTLPTWTFFPRRRAGGREEHEATTRTHTHRLDNRLRAASAEKVANKKKPRSLNGN